MQTYLDCLPCFLKQALEAAKIAGVDKKLQKEILDKTCEEIANFSLTASPPEMGKIVYGLVKKISGKNDPFKKIKEKSNWLALNIYPKLKQKIKKSDDKFLTAVELAIAGNIIDYGAGNSFDIEKEIEKILLEDFINTNKEIFDIARFKDDIKKTSSILYLADNAGEIVFDKILIEELWKLNKRIIFVVRAQPIINDVLAEDAYDCGIDKYADIISSGSEAPGTILRLCSKKFLELYKNAEMIISKGQGNFEALSAERKLIYFLFKVKCNVVARDIGCKKGSMVLRKL